jgi:3-methylcrotonyl-CoA carboxylase alpha subunit
VASGTILLRDSEGGEHTVDLAADGTAIIAGGSTRVEAAPDGSLHMVGGARNAVAYAVTSGGLAWVFLEGQIYTFEIVQGSRTKRRSAAHGGALAAPMPATVRLVAVAVGDVVTAGDVLILLEAMKMELPIRAGVDGTVTAINCREGEMVQPGRELVRVEETPAP